MVGGTTFNSVWAQPAQGGGTVQLQEELATHDANLAEHDTNVLDAITAINVGSTHGVIEINQDLAEAGGVTPGDRPGFPVRIDEPGSYRLTSNLTVNEHTSAITIFVPNVTLDLNGFAIIGPVTCVGTPIECSSSGVGIGISAAAAAINTTVMNGGVTGMGNIGVFLPGFCRVENLHVTFNAGIGIQCNNCIVRNNTVWLNGADGINSAGLVRENVVLFNGGFGLNTTNSSGYASNVFRGNNAGSVQNGHEIGGNVCNFSTTCP